MKPLLLLLAVALPSFALRSFASEVTGYVYLPNGDPVEGKVVKAGAASTTTAKDGKFVLSELPEGVVELEIGELRSLVLSGDFVSITLTGNHWPVEMRSAGSGELTVSGKVTLDGKPLANAPVIVGDIRVWSNAKGDYVAKGLPPGRHLVALDERLTQRVRTPYSQRIYAEGENPMMADLRKTRSATIDLPLRAAPIIRGRVTDADGKPVSRARVQLVIANRSALDFGFDQNASRTAPDGRYAFPAPEWDDSDPAVVAVTPLRQSTVRSKRFTVGKTDHVIDITVPKMETVRLRVLDVDGKPVPNARIAYAMSGEASYPESLTSLAEQGPDPLLADAAGEAVVELAQESYEFAVAAKGFQTRTTTKAITKSTTFDFTLEREATLRGRVHRGDRGVANVNVEVVGETLRALRTSTDSDGRFALPGLAPGTHRLVVNKEDEMIDRTLTADAPGEVDVELPLGGKLHGRVIDSATRIPQREFAIVVESLTTGQGTNTNRHYTTTDGTFTLDLAAGGYRITATAPGYTVSQAIDANVGGNEVTTVDIPLDRGAMLRGRVVDDTGLPLANAVVSIVPADATRRQLVERTGLAQIATTDDGAFTLAGIEPGPMQLTVRRSGYLVHQQTIEVEDTKSIEITLRRGLAIHGIVLRDGKPLGGAQVSTFSAALGSENQIVVSGEDGRFTISGLIPATYTVSASFEALRNEERGVDPRADRDVVIALDAKAVGVVYGVVTNMPPPEGKYTRRVVFAISENDSNGEGMIDDAGNYRIENAPAGKVTLMALVESSTLASRASARRQIEVVPGRPQRVDLDLGGSIRVRGHVTSDGKPAQAEVGFHNETGSASTRTSDDGAYEIALPSPGEYQIYARTERNDRGYTERRSVRGNDTIDIDFRERTFEGTVIDAMTRQPIAGARVTLSPLALANVGAEVQVNPAGQFRIVTNASGALRLIASAPGYAQRVAMAESSSSPYAFELPPGAEVRVRVLDKKTNVPLDAQVVFSDDTGILTLLPQRSGDGTSYLFTAAPGHYHVLVYVRGYELKTVDVDVPGAIDILME